jgi:hypothetical protein
MQEETEEARTNSTVFVSDTILIRVLDEEGWNIDKIYNFLTSEGELQFIDFSFFSFSKSICASFYDTRHAVLVSAKLQRLPGISCCIWKSSTPPDARVARVPLLFSVTLDPRFSLVTQFGDIDAISIEDSSDTLKVVFFDCRSKTRLIARLAELVAQFPSQEQSAPLQ